MKKKIKMNLIATGVLIATLASTAQNSVKADTIDNQANIKTQLDGTLNSIKKIESDLDNLKKQKDQMIEKLVVLERKSAEAKILLNEEKQKYEAERHNYEEIEKERNKKIQNLKKIKQEISELKSLLSAKQEALEQENKQLVELENNDSHTLTDEQQEKLQKLQNDYDEQSILRDNAIKALHDFNIGLNGIIRHYGERQDKIDKLKEEGKEDSPEYKKLINLQESIEKNIENIKADIIRKEKLKSKYDLSLQKLEIEIKVLKNQTNDQDNSKEINDKRSKITGLNDEINNLQISLKDKEQEVESYSSELPTDEIKPITDVKLLQARKNIDEINSKIKDTKNSISELEKNIDCFTNDLLQKKASAEELSTKLRQLEDKKEHISEKVKEIDGAIHQISKTENTDKNKNSNVNVKVKLTYGISSKENVKNKTYKFKVKNKKIYVLLNNQWVKVNKQKLSKYLTSKKSVLQANGRINTQSKKLYLLNLSGKKTNKTINKRKAVRITGIKMIKNKIYVYVSNKYLVQLKNIKI